MDSKNALNNISWLFLYTPLPWLGLMFLAGYRHDLGRIARPLVDCASPTTWWLVCRYLSLIPADAKRPRKKLHGFLPLLALPVSLATGLLWMVISLPLAWYGLCALQAGAALPLFLLLHHLTGPLPYRPYKDFLPYPRLGTRLRHLSRRKAERQSTETRTDSGTSVMMGGAAQ